MLYSARRSRCLQHCLLLTLVLFVAHPALAESADDEVGIANYAYTVFSGTGRYKVDDRTIFAFRAPLVWDLAEANYESGELGYRLLLPIAIGFTDFEDDEFFPDIRIDSLQTVSVVPGVEVVIPVAPKWGVKPFAQLGYGADLQSDSHTLIWGAGVRTRSSFGDSSRWLVGGEYLHAGNRPNQGDPASSFSRWGIGAEYKWSTNWQPYGHRVSWHGRLIQRYFTDAVNFDPPYEKTKINRSTELGVSFGIDPPISILGYKFTQGGIGYQFADGYDAITLFTTFPF